MVAQLTREGILEVISDIHKDAFGVRPRGVNYSAMPDKMLFDEYHTLVALAEAEDARERERQERAVAEWRARIDDMIRDFNIDRPTALRWDLQANDARDIDEYCWTLGLPYGGLGLEIEGLLKEAA